MAASPSYQRRCGPVLLALALLLAACGHSDTPPGPAAQQPVQASVTRISAGSAATGTSYTAVVQQIYIAYFGRPADTGGLASFEARLAELGAPNTVSGLDALYRSNAALRELVDSFGISAESAALYNGGTEAFVRAIYLNVLNRAADAEGLAFWVGEIDKGGLSRGNASLAILSGALTNTSPQGLLDGALITAKTNVATAFTVALVAGAQSDTYSGDAAAAKGRAMLSGVTTTASAASLAAQVASTVSALAPPLGYSASSLSGAYSYSTYFNDSSKSNATAVLHLNLPSVPYSGSVVLNVAKKGFTTETGTATFDGAGHYTINSVVNVDGVVSTQVNSGSYTVTPDGSAQIDNMAARLLPGGAMFVMASSSKDPQVGIAFKQGGTFSNASLSGTYGVIDYVNRVDVSNPVPSMRFPSSGTITQLPYTSSMTVPIQKLGFTSNVGTITFNGAGAFTYAIQTNADGVVSSDTGSGSYSVSADGTLSLEGAQGKVQGGGGSFFMVNTSGDPQIMIGTRAGSAMSNATLQGAYSVAGYENMSGASDNNVFVPYTFTSAPQSLEIVVPIAKKGFKSNLGTVTFDGAGGYVLSLSTNLDGVVTASTVRGAYAVSADGTVSIDNVRGRIQDGGRMFVFAATRGDPEIGFAIAKPSP